MLSLSFVTRRTKKKHRDEEFLYFFLLNFVLAKEGNQRVAKQSVSIAFSGVMKSMRITVPFLSAPKCQRVAQQMVSTLTAS
jgi:hypothetical protein